LNYCIKYIFKVLIKTKFFTYKKYFCYFRISFGTMLDWMSLAKCVYILLPTKANIYGDNLLSSKDNIKTERNRCDDKWDVFVNNIVLK